MTIRNFSQLLSAPPLPLVLLVSSLAACGGQRLSLGDNSSGDNTDGATTNALCNGGTWTGDVSARIQPQIDELFGCEVIEGSLHIVQPTGGELSLTPLSHLRQVHGDLQLDGIPSLTGLEALEQVGNLRLRGIGSSDLTALSSLRRVQWNGPGSGKGGGFIDLDENPNLQNLAGLEGVTVWSDLALIDSPSLTTLDGLSGPAFPGLVNLTNLPALRDVRALAFALGIDTLYLTHTGVESLEGLSLGDSQAIYVENNPALVSLSGLGGLRGVDLLSIKGNDSLIDVALNKLERASVIRIIQNDALNAIPTYPSSAAGGISFDEQGTSPGFLPLDSQLFEVGGNAQLLIVWGPDGFTHVQQLSIWGNPALTSLYLNHLERAEGLQIRDNVSLKQVSVPQLERVGDLEVVNNPALSIASFADLPTFSRSMSGNADVPAAPVP